MWVLYANCFCFWLTIFHFLEEFISNKSTTSEAMSKENLVSASWDLFLKNLCCPLVVTSSSFMWPPIIYVVSFGNFPNMEVTFLNLYFVKFTPSSFSKLKCVLAQIPQQSLTVLNTTFSNFLNSLFFFCFKMEIVRPEGLNSLQVARWSPIMFWFWWVSVGPLFLYHSSHSKE